MRLARVFRVICVSLFALLLMLPLCADAPVKSAGNVVTNIGWSPTAFYCAFRVDDPMIVGNQTLWLGQPWQDDAVAIYLSFDADADTITNQCLRVVISAAGGATVQRGGEGEWHDDASWFDPISPKGTIRYALKMLGKSQVNDNGKPDTGYQAELGLSWEHIGVPPPIRAAADGAVPTIRFAVVCYSQGETQAVSCWPEPLMAEDLNNPSTWGKLQFLQSYLPQALAGGVANANCLPGDPSVDGDIRVAEWLTSGVISYPKRVGGTTVSSKNQERQAVSLMTAWYTLDPFGGPLASQPLEPTEPWMGPDTPLYHLQQVREARKAGIDALAVAMPADPQQRAQTRRRLVALRMALQSYADTTAGTSLFDVPLLLPLVDLSTTDLDLRAPSGRKVVADALDDFYRIIPPQYRVMAPDGHARLCYPVILTNPSPATTWEPGVTAQLGDELSARWQTPIGWVLDKDWQGEEAQPGVLSRCSLDPADGLQLGEGPMLMTVIAPGAGTAKRDTLHRRDGETFGNGWLKITSARPDVVLIRSWNEYQRGTEISSSRVDGYQYLDDTKLAIMKLVQERGFGVRVQSHTLPAVLRAGPDYPVEVLLKNGSVQKIVTAEGFRIDYRITHDGDTVLAGLATEQVGLLEFSSSRIRFTLPTSKDRRPLAPGDYQLHLDIRRNKLPFVSSALLRQKLGTVTMAFTVAKETPSVQVIDHQLPDAVLTDGTGAITLRLRNTSRVTWKKGKAAFRLRWQRETGEIAPAEAVLVAKSKVGPGEIVTLQGDLPTAPHDAGWYTLILDMPALDKTFAPLTLAALPVTQTDLRVQFHNIALPRNIVANGQPVAAVLLLQNRGCSTWEPQQTRIVYQWLAWDGQTIPQATGGIALEKALPADAVTTIDLPVIPPAGAGSFRCVFGVEYAGEPVPVMAEAEDLIVPSVTVTLNAARFQPLDIAKAVNRDTLAAYPDTETARVDFDGQGNAFPMEEFLPDLSNPPLGYQPGYTFAAPNPEAPSFRFLRAVEGKAPAIVCAGQTIALPPTALKTLYFVATCTGDAHPATFTVRYADGMEQQVERTVSNWLGNPAHNEPVMLKTRHLHTMEGDNWYQHGSLFVYAIKLDPTQPAAALILPKAADVSLFAVTLEPAQ